MKTIIYRTYKGNKPEIYSRAGTLKKAKQILIDKYSSAITNCYEEIVDGVDTLRKDRKELILFNNRYWIEQDLTL